MAPTCSNCSGTEFVWANEVKTGTAGGLSLRPKGEVPIGTRICKNCGHADLFLHDLDLLKKPHLWKPGEFYLITGKPAGSPEAAPVAPSPSAPTPAPPIAPSPTPSAWPPPPEPPAPPAPEPSPALPAVSEESGSNGSSAESEPSSVTSKSRGSRKRGAKARSDDTSA